MIIQWNTENCALLEQMWNNDMTDAQITAHFGAGAWAIAKQRSLLGLTHHRRPKGLTRQPKTNYNTTDLSTFNVLMYNSTLDGQHYCVWRSDASLTSHFLALKILDKRPDVREVIILKPSQLITR